MHPEGTTEIPVCIVNDTRVDRHHGCFRVMTAIETLLAANGFSVAGTNPAHEDWEANGDFLRALDHARLVVVNGEGTIHHDRPAGRRLLRIGGYARARGIPAVLVNAGWESNGEEFHELLAEFTVIAARDNESARQMRQGGASCSVVPDLSLYGATQPAPTARSGGVLFSDSVDRFKAVELEKCRRTVHGTTLSIVYPPAGIRGYATFIREAFAIRDALTPGVLLDIIRMRHRLGRYSSSDISRFVETLGRAQLLVSGRFHACTLALTTGTPFVAIPSNTGKIASLIADAGLEPWRANTELTPEAILSARDEGWSPHEWAAIGHYLDTANTAARALFKELAKLV